MRELRIIADLSTAEEIIVEFVAPDQPTSPAGTTTTDEDSAADSRMRLPVTAELKALLIDDADAAPASTENSADAEAASAAPEAEPESAAEPESTSETKPEPEPEPKKPVTVLRPREIQDRIRAGASVAELAEETGMAERKIDAFAYPVLQERGRIAELAKQARPVRSDGPAELTLWDVLDTAFAARGNDIKDATWDAWRDNTGQWIVAVKFEVGLSSSSAEWSFHPGGGRAATAVARNNIAADLIDPDFANPVRSLSAVGPQRGQQRGEHGSPAGVAAPTANTSDSLSGNHVAGQAAMPAPPQPRRPLDPSAEDTATQQAVPHDIDDDEADDFLQHPDEEQPRRRRRKTVLPSWDDVLLDVRPTGKK